MSTSEAPTSSHVVGHQGARVEIAQRSAIAVNGWLGVVVLAGCVAWVVFGAQAHDDGLLWLPSLIFALVISALVIVPPGQTSVVQFFGRYIGTVGRPGFWWVAPLTVRRRVSVRVRNFETNRLKVNDADGSPVDIAAIVVWQVADTAKATYAVDDYADFVSMQAESALRHVATSHPYDDPTGRAPRCEARRTSSSATSPARSPSASRSPGSRSSRCGSPISPTRPRSPRRCCAASRRTPSSRRGRGSSRAPSGWSSSRSTGSPRTAWSSLDEERTASMVSNLMVVLCGEQPASPVVNTGSLYT